MKHAALLSKLGPSYPVYPDLIKTLKSSSAGILLGYLIHLTKTLAPKDGWIKHSSADIYEGTGLSYEMQLTARKKLKEQGLIEEKSLRLEHEMYFRVTGVAK